MAKNFSIIPDQRGLTLLTLPKQVDNIYWLDGVIHEGTPPVNQLQEGQVLAFQTPKGKEGLPNFRVTVSKIFADGDYFGKSAVAFEDIFESSDWDSKLLKTKKQEVAHMYGGSKYKVKSIIKDGEEVCSITRQTGLFGSERYIDLKGRETISERNLYGISREIQEQRTFYPFYSLKGKLQRFILKCSTYKDTGCEIPYIRKLGGFLFRLIK